MSRGSIDRTIVSWLLVAIVAVTVLAFGALDEGGPQTNNDRTFGISRTILCPQCTGQSVAESDVAIAREIRADIAERVDRGESDDTIRQVYVDRYGAEILLNPSGSGLAGMVWVIPVVGVVAAAAVLGFAFWRANASPLVEASDADKELVDRARRE